MWVSILFEGLLAMWGLIEEYVFLLRQMWFWRLPRTGIEEKVCGYR